MKSQPTASTTLRDIATWARSSRTLPREGPCALRGRLWGGGGGGGTRQAVQGALVLADRRIKIPRLVQLVALVLQRCSGLQGAQTPCSFKGPGAAPTAPGQTACVITLPLRPAGS